MIFRSRASTAASSFDPTVEALRGAAHDAQRSRLPQMAAALSYRTIFGLVPVIAIGLVLIHRIARPEQLSSIIRLAIERLGLDKIFVDQTFVGPVMPGTPDAPTQQVSNSLDTWIAEFIERINNINFAAINVVGVIMLIYAAISMVVEVERAFNQIFRVPRGRSWARRLTVYWTLLTLGPLCLFATFYIGQRLDPWVKQISDHIAGFTGSVLSSVQGVSTGAQAGLVAAAQARANQTAYRPAVSYNQAPTPPAAAPGFDFQKALPLILAAGAVVLLSSGRGGRR
jgi:uncharacterized BrkB/YihY/UPF0761 family membrane protein